MMRHAASLLLAALVALAIARDAEAGRRRSSPIRFDAPTSGSEVTWMPLDVGLSLRSDLSVPTLLVTLNGEDVTSAFTVHPLVGSWRAATAEDLWDGLVVPGANTLEARAQDSLGVLRLAQSSFAATGDAYADALVSY
ncbi:MAG: hypothetical protein L0206_22385, partial [Actinobacteria bacterium]|nr:hypothetical protein [Actinomycetota bacterium]